MLLNSHINLQAGQFLLGEREREFPFPFYFFCREGTSWFRIKDGKLDKILTTNDEEELKHLTL
jgi:hypothetical protein